MSFIVEVVLGHIDTEFEGAAIVEVVDELLGLARRQLQDLFDIESIFEFGGVRSYGFAQ